MVYGQIYRNPQRGYRPGVPVVDRALIPPKPKRVHKSAATRLAEAPAVVELLPEPATPAPVLAITNDRLILRQVVEHVAAITGVDVGVLLGGCRFAHVSTARHYAFYLSRQRGNYSLPRIGTFFGRHHTTVLNGCRSIEVLAVSFGADELEARVVEKFRHQRELYLRDLPKAARE